MEIMTVFYTFLWRLIEAAPLLFVWTAMLIVSIRLMRRNRGTSERFLVIGAALGVLVSLVIIPLSNLIAAYYLKILSTEQALESMAVYNITRDTISAAGIICFIYAFWVKFNIGDSAAAGPAE